MARKSVRDPRADTWFERLPASHWTHVAPSTGAGTTRAPADHVLVGPSGVYVVVRRLGALDIDVVDTRVAAASVAALLPVRYRPSIVPVLCVEDDDPIAESHGDVLVTGLSTLEHVVRSSPVVLSTSEVRGLGAALAGVLGNRPAAPDKPPRRPVPLAALGCVAATAAVVCLPWADDAWQVLRSTGVLG